MDKKWKFCFANGCWWVVIDNMEQFLEYKNRTSSKFGHAVVNGACKDENKYHRLYETAHLIAENRHISVVEGMVSLADTMFAKQHAAIREGHTLWFNELGGYNYGLDNQRKNTIYRENLVFPHYTLKDIRISQWGDKNGHYYAKVGEVEVKEKVNGETIMKWDTYDEAYSRALEYVKGADDDED